MDNPQQLIESLESENDLVKNSTAQIIQLLVRDRLAKRIKVSSRRNSIGNEEGKLLDQYLELRRNIPSKYSNSFLVSYYCGEFCEE